MYLNLPLESLPFIDKNHTSVSSLTLYLKKTFLFVQGGRKCQIEEIIEAFTRALDEAVQEESDTASQIAEEEWEAIRPTKVERREFLLGKIKKYISKNGICDNCTFWEMKTGETWGQEYQNLSRNITSQLIPVGTWRPSDGATMIDELFLHIAHGFRKKILPMVTFHVS
nr:ionotropic receptor 93a-like [Leptinotarsa decemlineata]